MITFSIIVPVYNVFEFLERCIDSIVAQTYKAVEILLIDDGSTDGSGELCDIIASRDSRICVYHKKMEDCQMPEILDWIGLLEIM